jgi:hypothetical protein
MALEIGDLPGYGNPGKRILKEGFNTRRYIGHSIYIGLGRHTILSCMIYGSKRVYGKFILTANGC